MFLRFENLLSQTFLTTARFLSRITLCHQVQNMNHGNITVAVAFNFPEFFISCSHVENLDWVVLVFQNKLGKLSQSTPSGRAQCRKKGIELCDLQNFPESAGLQRYEEVMILEREGWNRPHLKKILSLKWVFFSSADCKIGNWPPFCSLFYKLQ